MRSLTGSRVRRYAMGHMTSLRTGSRFVPRQRRGHNKRKRFVIIATLLTVVAGVQLVTIGRYTMSVIFVVDAADTAIVSGSANDNCTTTSFTTAYSSDFAQTTTTTTTKTSTRLRQFD